MFTVLNTKILRKITEHLEKLFGKHKMKPKTYACCIIIEQASKYLFYDDTYMLTV